MLSQADQVQAYLRPWTDFNSLVQIYLAWVSPCWEPITERRGSSKTMTTYMRHTEAVCLYLWIHLGSGREVTFWYSLCVHTNLLNLWPIVFFLV